MNGCMANDTGSPPTSSNTQNLILTPKQLNV